MYWRALLVAAMVSSALGAARSAHARDETPGPDGATKEKTTIAVMAVDAAGINEEHVGPLSEVLTTELTALGRFEVISARDIQAMLAHEAGRHAAVDVGRLGRHARVLSGRHVDSMSIQHQQRGSAWLQRRRALHIQDPTPG